MWKTRPYFPNLTKLIVAEIIKACSNEVHQIDDFQLPVFTEKSAQFSCFTQKDYTDSIISFDGIPWYKRNAGEPMIKPRKSIMVLANGQKFIVYNCVCPKTDTFKKHVITSSKSDEFYVVYSSTKPIEKYSKFKTNEKRLSHAKVVEIQAALSGRNVLDAYHYLIESGLKVTLKQVQNQTRGLDCVIKTWMTDEQVEKVMESRDKVVLRRKRQQPQLYVPVLPVRHRSHSRTSVVTSLKSKVRGKTQDVAQSEEPEAQESPDDINQPSTSSSSEVHLEEPEHPVSARTSQIKELNGLKAMENGELSFMVKSNPKSDSMVEVKLSADDELTCTLRYCIKKLPAICDHVKKVLGKLPPNRKENAEKVLYEASEPSTSGGSEHMEEEEDVPVETPSRVEDRSDRGHGRQFRLKFGFREIGELFPHAKPAPPPPPDAPLLRVDNNDEEPDDDLSSIYSRMVKRKKTFTAPH